jgi:hypothetical protein
MGDSRLARCLQGGGVLVWGGTVYGGTETITVTISSCTISGNSAVMRQDWVRAHVQKFPLPHGLPCFRDLRCYLTFPTSHPGTKCLCQCQSRQRRLLLANDPNRRRRWPSLNLSGTPSSIAAALAAATAIAAALAATAATVSAGDRGGEHRRRPDQCTRQHRRRPHRPGPRHLLPQRRAQRHQERRPRGGGGRLGRAGCTSQLRCAEHRPGLVGRRASDRAQHYQGVCTVWRRCRCLWRHRHDYFLLDLWKLGPGRSAWRRRCPCRWWHGGHLIVHHHWQHSLGWRRCRCLWRHSGHLIVHHHWQHSLG